MVSSFVAMIELATERKTRFWDFEVRGDPEACVARVETLPAARRAVAGLT